MVGGVQDILVVAVDNLTGFSGAIAHVFSRSDVQKGFVHQIRNSLKYVARKDFAAITADLKPIYQADTEEGTKLAMNTLEEAWGKKYPKMVRSWRENWTELMTFFQYRQALRKILYTTNLVEGFHRQLRKVIKSQAQFPTDDALVKMLYLATREELGNGPPGFRIRARSWVNSTSTSKAGCASPYKIWDLEKLFTQNP